MHESSSLGQVVDFTLVNMVLSYETDVSLVKVVRGVMELILHTASFRE